MYNSLRFHCYTIGKNLNKWMKIVVFSIYYPSSTQILNFCPISSFNSFCSCFFDPDQNFVNFTKKWKSYSMKDYFTQSGMNVHECNNFQSWPNSTNLKLKKYESFSIINIVNKRLVELTYYIQTIHHDLYTDVLLAGFENNLFFTFFVIKILTVKLNSKSFHN